MTLTDDAVDGRRLQRDREAVVQALLEPYREGNPSPSTDAVTARAGISARSLFRYVDQGLSRAAATREMRLAIGRLLGEGA